jgi:nucleoid-associated protein YgaU
MGLFDFVKQAGEDLLARAGGATGPDAASIEKAIAGHGLSIENLSVKVDEDRVTLAGKAASQQDKEKAVLAAGNVKGVAKVDDQLEVAKAEPAATFYTVESGDTLSKIAKAHYGDAQKYPVIFEANRPLLKDPDKIYPGQVLRIPPQG